MLSINEFLKSHNLFSFPHRMLRRFFLFSYKIINSSNTPLTLKNALSFKDLSLIPYSLRSESQFVILRNKTGFGDLTFHYFFSKLLNYTCIKFLSFPYNQFLKHLNSTFDVYFNKFTEHFTKFNLELPIFYK